MFNRFKSAVIGAVSGLEVPGSALENNQSNRASLAPKFPYGRPHFLCLGDDEVQMSADHKLRPIIHPSKPLPHDTGVFTQQTYHTFILPNCICIV